MKYTNIFSFSCKPTLFTKIGYIKQKIFAEYIFF